MNNDTTTHPYVNGKEICPITGKDLTEYCGTCSDPVDTFEFFAESTYRFYCSDCVSGD